MLDRTAGRAYVVPDRVALALDFACLTRATADVTATMSTQHGICRVASLARASALHRYSE